MENSNASKDRCFDASGKEPLAELLASAERMSAAAEVLIKAQVERDGVLDTLHQIQRNHSCLEERLEQLLAKHEQHIAKVIKHSLSSFFSESMKDNATDTPSPRQGPSNNSDDQMSPVPMQTPEQSDTGLLEGIPIDADNSSYLMKRPSIKSCERLGKRQDESADPEPIQDATAIDKQLSKVAKMATVSVFDFGNMSQVRIRALKVLRSQASEYVVASMIVMSSMFMAVQTEILAQNLREPQESWLRGVDLTFSAFFCMELALRMFAERGHFFTGPDSSWNILDFAVVLIAIIEEIMKAILDYASSSAKVLRILRILRLVRVVKFVRAMRFFNDLRAMVFGIMQSITALFWAIVLLVAIIFLFSVYTTQVVAYYFMDQADKGSQDMSEDSDSSEMLKENFGSLLTTMYTHWVALSGGADWGIFAKVLHEASPVCAGLFVFYIAFGVCAVLNVVTGVFVNRALKVAEGDQDIVILEKNDEHKELVKAVRMVFSKADVNDDLSLDKEEFARHMCNPFVQAYFRYLDLQLEGTDPRVLFDMLDFDEDGSIDVEEFIFGCSVLKGSARSLDLARLAHRTHRQSGDILELGRSIATAQEQQVQELSKWCRRLSSSMQGLEEGLQGFSARSTTPPHQQVEVEVENYNPAAPVSTLTL